MAFNFVNQNPLKETEFKDRMKDNDYSIVPKLKSNFHDVFAELEKEMAEDPGRKIAFADAADNPVMIGDVVKGQANPLQEVVPNIIYGQNSGQGNLLKSIDNKTVRTFGNWDLEGCTLFLTQVLFSVTHDSILQFFYL